MQSVTSPIIFVSNDETPSNITEQRTKITLQSAFGHVMEPIRGLGSYAMCNACGIIIGNRPPDTAKSHCWQMVWIRRPVMLIMWCNADWTDLAQKIVLQHILVKTATNVRVRRYMQVIFTSLVTTKSSKHFSVPWSNLRFKSVDTNIPRQVRIYGSSECRATPFSLFQYLDEKTQKVYKITIKWQQSFAWIINEKQQRYSRPC
jgi:hypothetical protein